MKVTGRIVFKLPKNPGGDENYAILLIFHLFTTKLCQIKLQDYHLQIVSAILIRDRSFASHMFENFCFFTKGGLKSESAR